MIINPTNRDDIRQRAIETTSDIVLKCGNLSVRMDDVAQELSVCFTPHAEITIANTKSSMAAAIAFLFFCLIKTPKKFFAFIVAHEG